MSERGRQTGFQRQTSGARRRSTSRGKQLPDETIIEEEDKIAKPLGLLQTPNLSTIKKRSHETNLLAVVAQLKDYLQKMSEEQILRIFESLSSERWTQVKKVTEIEWSEGSAWLFI